jgi:hypothetical protein
MNTVSSTLRQCYVDMKAERDSERSRLGITTREAVFWDRFLIGVFLLIAGVLVTTIVVTADNGVCWQSVLALVGLFGMSVAFMVVGDKIRTLSTRVRVFSRTAAKQ